MTPKAVTRRAVLGGALAVVALLALGACEDRKKAALRGADGQPAPDLVALRPDGTAVSLAELKGKVVLLNFWLAECGPCLAEMPEFDAFYQRHRDQGLEILAVNMGQAAETIDKTSRRLALSFPLLADPLRITTERYNVLAAPTSFIIDGEGRLVERINGPLDQNALAEKIGPLL
jgi:peroxiredoxin